MNRGWHNNIFNKRIWEEMPREFSLEDIDGVIRFHYKDNNGFIRTRLIIYEIKKKDEKIELPQLKTLFLLKHNINWIKFDERSGVFIIQALDENFNKTKIFKLRINEAVLIQDNVDFDYYREWFYNDKKQLITMKCPKCGCENINILDIQHIDFKLSIQYVECSNCCFYGEKSVFFKES